MLIHIEDIPPFEITKGFIARMFHTDNMTIAYVYVEEGAVLPEHSHFNEQISSMLEGRFEFVLDGKTTILEPGMSMVIPSNVRHSGKALTRCVIMDVFQPVREDFRKGEVAYAMR